jgi:hydroxypyruvate isomerase
VVAHAQGAGVRVLMELLNSKVDHPGQQCDRTAFGAAVVRQVGSPTLKLLYDGYHMQLMEGDLSRTIKANLDLIGHIHTAGAPGRRDLDDRQEINWRGVAGLLRHLDYGHWVGHEFIPRGEPIAALKQAIALFNADERAA